jgi:DNA-binding NarL/FixJ family response regulator
VKVLIVDDSSIVRKRLAVLLSDVQNVEIAGEAQNAEEAWELTRKLTPDVVILDIHLPGGSGIHVLKRIKREAPAPKVIILTNYDYPQYRKQCLEAGAEAFLDKLTEIDRIRSVITQWASRSSRE